MLSGAVLLPAADGSVAFLPHAQVHWDAERVVAVRPVPAPAGSVRQLLLPGFVDLHCHWPQSHVRGQFGGELLPWLRESIWPAEAAFGDPAVAADRATGFRADIVRAGTCAGLFFGAPFAEATRTFLQATPEGFLEGPAIMSRNAPPAVLCPAQTALARLAAFPGHLRARLAIAPRFAPNLSAADLRDCAGLAGALGLPVQSHLAENLDELAWVRALFPEARDYTEVYETAGLLGSRTVLAHAVHVTDTELARLAATRTVIAHCPTSNQALASGRMPLERLRRAGVEWVLATDVGAGPKLSQLHVMQTLLQVHADHAAVTAAEALARATAIPGAWLAAANPLLRGLGTLEVGAPAHIVALRMPDLPRRGQTAEAVLRALLATPAAAMETLPQQVVLWGRVAAGT